MSEFLTLEAHKHFEKRIEDENNRQNHRIQNLEENMKQIQDIVISVEKMAVALENITSEIQRQGIRLEQLEAEPAEKWRKAVWIVISALIGAAIAASLKGIGV